MFRDFNLLLNLHSTYRYTCICFNVHLFSAYDSIHSLHSVIMSPHDMPIQLHMSLHHISSHRIASPTQIVLHTAYDLCKERLCCVKSGTLSPKSNMTTMSTMSTGNFLWVDMAAVDPLMEQKAALESKIVGLKVPYTFAPLTGCSVQMTGTTLLQWQPRTAMNSRWIPAMEIDSLLQL